VAASGVRVSAPALPGSPDAPLRAELAELRQALEAQSRELAALRHRIAVLEQPSVSAQAEEKPAPTGAIPGTDLDPQAHLRARLISTGISSEIAQEIVEMSDAALLNRLELQDAARQGDAEARKTLREQVSFDRSLRERFGDDVYDRYLFASGQPNRARVTRVLRGSNADRAGLRSGDDILSVAGQRTFSLAEMQRTITAAKGSTVLEVSRNDTPLSLAIDPGPLGVELVAVSANPQASGADR